MQVLLIEDNLDLSANIGEFLESKGHAVDYARDGIKGLELAGTDHYDAVILDLGLPGLDGTSLCRRLRESSRGEVPLLMLTARDTEADKLRGFEAGADDYLTKPFSLLELLARLNALVRRATGTKGVLQVADLTFDVRTGHVRRGERLVTLAPIGKRILEQLMRASPALVTREQLLRTVWGNDPPETAAALRVQIFAIRSEIERSGETKLLQTVHGTGYRLA
ncbi:MAG TPA: response regulator transcription factor [Steroidobacteraceae bacterium]|nr:response regulator transcription factor [Steroidobacteraceae bacterium]